MIHSFVLILVAATILTPTSIGLGSGQELIIDDFNTGVLNSSIWTWGPNSQQATYYFDQGKLYITGGITPGGGGTIKSNDSYIYGTDILVFETRVRLYSDYYAHWGFWANNHDGLVLFQQHPEGLMVAFRKNNQTPPVNISIPGVDLSVWHDYKLKLHNSYVEVYIDGELLAVQTSDLPIGKPLLVWFSQTSDGTSYTQAVDYIYLKLEPEALNINIDIKPEDNLNIINPNSNGVIPVAILTTPIFDATSIKINSLCFGPSLAPIAHKNGHIQDINGDGSLDLLVHFYTQEIGISCSSTSIILNGEILSGQTFIGEDLITTTGCE